MNVSGPNWPSTQALAVALTQTPPFGYTLQWGHRVHNGWQQLVKFAEAGVPCPLATDFVKEAYEACDEGQTVWGRKYNHTQGTDIVGLGHKRWPTSDFWVVPIPIAEEFRQHVWDGRCIRIGKKVQTGEATRKLPVRSRKNGWTIDYAASPEEPLRTQLREAAVNAVNALGYVGGAVDLIQGTDGKVYVLEVNTAPSLRDENTLGAYVKAITRWAKKQKTG